MPAAADARARFAHGRICRALATLAACAMLAVVLCARIARAQDDWKVIERHTTSQAPAEAGADARRQSRLQTAPSRRAVKPHAPRATLTRLSSRSSTICGARISRFTNR